MSELNPNDKKKLTPKNIFSDGEASTDVSFSKGVKETLYFAYKPFLTEIIFVLILGFIGRVLLLSNMNIIGFWVDSLCTDSPNCHPAPPLFANFTNSDYLQFLSLLALGGFLFSLHFRVRFSRLSARAISKIYDEVTYRTSRYPLSFFDQTPAGRIITRFSSDYGSVFRLFGGPLAEFISIIFELITMVILIVWASPYYLGIILFIVGMNYAVFKANQLKLRQARREMSAARSPSIAHFAETTQGASAIRSFRKQKSFTERFLKLDDHFLKNRISTTKKLIGFSFQMNSMTSILFLGTGLFAYWLSSRNLVSIGSIGVAFGFIALSGNTVQMFFEWLTQFEEALIGMERLDRYLRLPIETGNKIPQQAQFATDHLKMTPANFANIENFKKNLPERSSIQIQDLWFRYADDLPWILKGLNFEIKPGERFGIVGRTGSGKSTLIQLLFYLYPINKGKILVDHVGPRLSDTASADKGIELEAFRSQISFIAQDPTLFQGTMRLNLDSENIFSDEALISVLTKVGLSLPLDLRIEEKGKNLSVGERQLVCMARCLLQKTPIVVMDEATSSVDPQSEEILVKATEDFFSERTQIIVAHRLTTLKKCDRILWLQNGEVKALGETKEVLKKFEHQIDLPS